MSSNEHDKAVTKRLSQQIACMLTCLTKEQITSMRRNIDQGRPDPIIDAIVREPNTSGLKR